MADVAVGIVNVTGYIGVELARLLHEHPKVRLVSVTGRRHLAGAGLTIEPDLAAVDFAFVALPHGESAAAVTELLERGVRVVDVGADFRLKDVAEYERWYKVKHPAPGYVDEAVYGLAELNREQVAAARLVAGPGCYPTGAILALAPAVREGLIEPDIIVDSKSGVSGAGRTLALTAHYAEANESVAAYALDGHRHLPEMLQGLQALAPGTALSITFVPHLVPMTRGILTTCYARMKGGTPGGDGKVREKVARLYRDFYGGEPFVKVVDAPPRTKDTSGTNLCLVHPTVDLRTGRLVVVSCIDNLVKGGAGQAVQCMNLMLGFPEATGLERAAVYP